jgi:protein-S-isoprenylcysteine O-methyltransferase Ste14
MHLWIPKATIILGILVVVAIRVPYGRRSSQVKVIKSKRGRLEIVLLSAMWLGSVILPLLWVSTPVFSFADYPLHPAQYAAGVVLFSLGLWLFHRSHVDLSTNWSVSLDIRENHALITSGVYRRLRHPMYSAILLQAVGQALVAPNWIVGSFYLCAYILMFSFRVGPEEQMMLQQFGDRYASYMAKSQRLIPGIW